MRAEARHEILVEQLKDKSCEVRFEIQEESCFEVEDIDDDINEDFKLDVKEEHFDESGLESTSDEEK